MIQKIEVENEDTGVEEVYYMINQKAVIGAIAALGTVLLGAVVVSAIASEEPLEEDNEETIEGILLDSE